MTETQGSVVDGARFTEQETRDFVTSHWGNDWSVKKLENVTGWSSFDICRFRKEEEDRAVYDFSESAPRSFIMTVYGYSRPAFQSLIRRARATLRNKGKELRTEVKKSPNFYADVLYYNLKDLDEASRAFRDRRLHRRLQEGLGSYTSGDVPHDLTKEEHALFLALIVWHVKYPYGPAPTFRKLGKVIQLSYSSVGVRVRSLLAKQYIDRKVEMQTGIPRGKKVSYRILKAPPLLHDRLIRANPKLVLPFSKN